MIRVSGQRSAVERFIVLSVMNVKVNLSYSRGANIRSLLSSILWFFISPPSIICTHDAMFCSISFRTPDNVVNIDVVLGKFYLIYS